MFGFLARHRGVFLGGGLALLALGILSSGGERRGAVGRSVGLLTAPVQMLVSGIADGIGFAVDHYVLLVGASQEADRLRLEVGDLKRELLQVHEVALENERLRSLLEFKQTSELRLLPARVVGRSASAWFRTLVVDKGGRDGVVADSPAVTPAGVVGRVYEVSPSSSRVLLLTDAASAVDAIVQRTRTQVVVEGDLGPTCRALYIARGEEVRAGDRVVTSGLGGVFPKGLLLGELARVKAPPGEMFQAGELVPSADFSRLEEVFIGLGEEARGEP